MPSSRITVVTSVYNGRQHLPDAVESVLQQNYGEFEFLLVDDGSTDGASDMLDEYARRDHRVRVIHQENKGQVPSLIEAMKQVTTPLVARFDADDICDPTRLTKQVAYMEAHPEVVLLGGGYMMVDEAGRRLRTMRPPPDDVTLQRHCLIGRTPICHPLAVFRTDAYHQAGGYDASYAPAEDLDLWLRLGEVGRMACLQEVLLSYRLHPRSLSAMKHIQQIENMERACTNAWVRRDVEGRFEGGDWRVDAVANSRHARLLKFGWWAWQSGESRTAVHYGWRSVFTGPFDAGAWKLLMHGLLQRGRHGRVSS